MRSKKRLSNAAPVAMRMALAAGFLSAVADRFGLWGPIGTPGVSWGGFAKFLDYTATTSPLPADHARGGCRLGGDRGRDRAGRRTPRRRARVRLAALASGVLLLTFAIAMTTALGPEALRTVCVRSRLLARRRPDAGCTPARPRLEPGSVRVSGRGLFTHEKNPHRGGILGDSPRVPCPPATLSKTAGEKRRNIGLPEIGHTVIVMTDRHPLGD